MWAALINGTIPWFATVAILVLALAATALIVHLVRASDGDMTVRLWWLGLHVQHKAANANSRELAHAIEHTPVLTTCHCHMSQHKSAGMETSCVNRRP